MKQVCGIAVKTVKAFAPARRVKKVNLHQDCGSCRGQIRNNYVCEVGTVKHV